MQEQEGKPEAPAPPPPAPHPEWRRSRDRGPIDKFSSPLSTVRFADQCACCPSKSCGAPSSGVPELVQAPDDDLEKDDEPPELAPSDDEEEPVKAAKPNNEEMIKDFLNDKIPGLFDIIEEYTEEDVHMSFAEFMEKAGKKLKEED